MKVLKLSTREIFEIMASLDLPPKDPKAPGTLVTDAAVCIIAAKRLVKGMEKYGMGQSDEDE